MADYTTQLRTICEFYAGETESQGYNKIPEIVAKSAPNIFEEFEIFDEDYRLPLEIKILRHFYTREICMETVGLWKLHFNNKMNEIMPYYNQLYKSALLEFNPFWDVDYTREHDRQNDGTAETDTKNTHENDSILERNNEGEQQTNYEADTLRDLSEENERKQVGSEDVLTENENIRKPNLTNEYKPDKYNTKETNRYMDTPQGHVSDPLDTGYLTDLRVIDREESGSYKNTETGSENNTTNNTSITNNENVDNSNRSVNDVNHEDSTRKNKHNDNTLENTSNSGKDTSKTNTNTTNIENYFEKVRGKQGTKSYSKMLEEFRKTFLNIDMMIIRDLEPLFFGLW